MRYQDIKLTEAELMEINMSPGNLKRLAAGIDARAGMEFEMCVPGTSGDPDYFEPEPDYDYDERARSIDDVINFFHDGDYNSRRTVEELRNKLQNRFEEWVDEKLMDDWSDQGMDQLYEYVKNNVDDDTIIKELGLDTDAEGNPPVVGRKEWARYAEQCMEEHNDTYNEAYEEWRNDWYNSSDDQEGQWLEHEGLDLMSDIENEFSISWPHWTDQDSSGASIESIAQEFESAIGRPVNWSNNYHGGKRTPDAYVVEPDGSIDVDDEQNDSGLEFVSPPLPLDEMFKDLEKVKKWANRNGCYTNDSTGLHINVSVPDSYGSQLDYVKLALLLGDEHILEVFGRMGNTYCKSAVEVVKKRVKNNPDAAENLLNQMREHLGAMATKAIHSGSTDKYTSINTKSGYVEFRSPGGDWLNKLSEGNEIQDSLLRFVVALDAATKPELYREEYLKKLYKVLDVKNDQDPLWYFVKYSAGGFSPTVLKSFIRQTQLERKVKKASTNDDQLPWRLWDVSTNEWATDSKGQGVYFDGTRDEALRQVKDWIQHRRNSGDTHNYDLQRNKTQPAQQSQDNLRPYELYSRTLGAVFDTFMARNDDEAMIRLNDYREHGAGQSNPNDFGVRPADSGADGASTTASHPEGRGRPHDPTGQYAIVARSDQAVYGRTGGPAPVYQFRFNMANLADQGHGRYVLQAWAARNGVNPADYIVVDTTQYNNLGPSEAPAPQPTGEFTGQWKVLVNGNEVWRFRGVGNMQADANRVASDWLRDNGYSTIGNQIEVYPVMG